MDNFLTFLLTKKGVLTVCASVSTVTFGSYQFNDYVHDRSILDSINIQFKESAPAADGVVQAPVVEYGDTNYDVTTLIESKEGDITLPAVDITTVGEQTLTFKVSRDGQEKEFTKVVEVKDTQAPQISLSESTTIAFESEFDPTTLVQSVSDPIDGAIAVGSEESTVSYYVIDSTVDSKTPGDYSVTVKAVDKNGNESSASTTVTVKEKVVEEEEKEESISNYTAPDASVIAGGVVSIAMNYNGAPYAYGGTSPETGFDCSGFVQYVFGQAGVSLPRTAGAQGAAGAPVAEADLQAGDVIVYNGGSHVAIYIGGGQIIHALNPSMGVRVTSMYGYGTITAIARY